MLSSQRKPDMTTTTATPPVDEKEIERIRKWAEEYARKHGYKLNPNEKQLNVVLRGLARIKSRAGEQYCPCRVRSGDKETDKIIICPCVYHEDEITKEGHCHCNLFHAGGMRPAEEEKSGNTDS
jgi:ferredoxin-thioredoxin reductase catalytic chain